MEPAGLRAIWLIWRRMSSSATAAVTPRIRARAASLTAGGPRETWTRLWPWAPVLVAASRRPRASRDARIAAAG